MVLVNPSKVSVFVWPVTRLTPCMVWRTPESHEVQAPGDGDVEEGGPEKDFRATLESLAGLCSVVWQRGCWKIKCGTEKT